MKTICFDLDGVICSQTDGDYKIAVLNKEAVVLINKLYNEGNKIVIYTSRFMGRNNSDVIKTYKEGYEFTKAQLAGWDIKFHELIMGKPRYDVLVDDKAVFFKKNWKELYKVLSS